MTLLFDCDAVGSRETVRLAVCRSMVTLHHVSGRLRRVRLWPVTLLLMQTDAPFWDSLVFDGIDDVDVEAVTAAFGAVDVVVRGRATGATCPDCDRFSDRVHDRYQRRLKDLPLGEQSVVILLTVRRFICGSAHCPRRTFAEPFAQLTAPYSRFTTRLNHALDRVGLALAGRAGARLAAQLGFRGGRMTFMSTAITVPYLLVSPLRVIMLAPCRCADVTTVEIGGGRYIRRWESVVYHFRRRQAAASCRGAGRPAGPSARPAARCAVERFSPGTQAR